MTWKEAASRVRYKPGWRLEVHYEPGGAIPYCQGDTPQRQLFGAMTIHYPMRDSARTLAGERSVPVEDSAHLRALPPMEKCDRPEVVLFEAIMTVERHEAAEHFEFNGYRPFYPHASGDPMERA